MFNWILSFVIHTEHTLVILAKLGSFGTGWLRSPGFGLEMIKREQLLTK